MDEGNFKREEDRKWREKIDHEMLTCMTSLQVIEQRLKTLEKALYRQDRLLMGDAEKETDGLLARQHSMETEIRKFNAVLFRDALGRGGLVADVDDLKGKREDKRDRLKVRGSIAIAIITSGALLLREWPTVRGAFVDAFHLYQTASGRQTPSPHSKRSGSKRHKRVEPPPEETSDEGSDEGVQ